MSVTAIVKVSPLSPVRRRIGAPYYQLVGRDPQELVDNCLSFQRREDIANAQPEWSAGTRFGLPDIEVRVEIFGQWLRVRETLLYSFDRRTEPEATRLLEYTIRHMKKLLENAVARFVLYGDKGLYREAAE